MMPGQKASNCTAAAASNAIISATPKEVAPDRRSGLEGIIATTDPRTASRRQPRGAFPRPRSMLSVA